MSVLLHLQKPSNLHDACTPYVSVSVLMTWKYITCVCLLVQKCARFVFFVDNDIWSTLSTIPSHLHFILDSESQQVIHYNQPHRQSLRYGWQQHYTCPWPLNMTRQVIYHINPHWQSSPYKWWCNLCLPTVKMTSKQDEQDSSTNSSTNSSTQLTPRLMDDSLTNLSTNGLPNRQPTPLSPLTQHQYSYHTQRLPSHQGLPPTSYWSFRDSLLIPHSDVWARLSLKAVAWAWLLGAQALQIWSLSRRPCKAQAVACWTSISGCGQTSCSAIIFVCNTQNVRLTSAY